VKVRKVTGHTYLVDALSIKCIASRVDLEAPAAARLLCGGG